MKQPPATAGHCEMFSLHVLHICLDSTADAGNPCTEPRLQCFNAEMLDVPSRPGTAFCLIDAINGNDWCQTVRKHAPESRKALVQQGRFNRQAPTPYTVSRYGTALLDGCEAY